LGIRSNSSGVGASFKGRYYKNWIAPYLYYFDFAIDQRFFVKKGEKRKGVIMLVPKGAKEPKVFQRKFPIRNCTYISNHSAFTQF